MCKYRKKKIYIKGAIIYTARVFSFNLLIKTYKHWFIINAVYFWAIKDFSYNGCSWHNRGRDTDCKRPNTDSHMLQLAYHYFPFYLIYQMRCIIRRNTWQNHVLKQDSFSLGQCVHIWATYCRIALRTCVMWLCLLGRVNIRGTIFCNFANLTCRFRGMHA